MMSKVTDAFLATIAQVTNDKAEESYNTEITLIAGGMLISGLTASASEYYEHHPLSKKFGEVVQKNLEQEADEDDGDEEVWIPPIYFIHLKNAKYWTPSGCIPSDGEGLFIRVKLEDITGFHFGTLRRS